MLIKFVDIVLISKDDFYLDVIFFLYVWTIDGYKANEIVSSTVLHRTTTLDCLLNLSFYL